MDLHAYYHTVALILSGVFGLCIGSFLNVVIYRVPLHMNIAHPASHCPKCDYQLKWYDNIPVLSYLLLGGRCRSCREKISPRYTAVELLNAVLWFLSAWIFWEKSPVFALISMAAVSVFICICFIDLEHMLIFDRFQLILLALGILALFFDPSPAPLGGWLSHLIGGAAGFGSLWLIAFAAEKILHRDALGGGDIKLCGVAGLLLGWQKFLFGVLLASLVGSIILLTLKNREKGREYPFAPFLTFGFTAALLFGEPILQWYLTLVGITI